MELRELSMKFAVTKLEVGGTRYTALVLLLFFKPHSHSNDWPPELTVSLSTHPLSLFPATFSRLFSLLDCTAPQEGAASNTIAPHILQRIASFVSELRSFRATQQGDGRRKGAAPIGAKLRTRPPRSLLSEVRMMV